MKKNYFKNFISLFFIALFSFKGIISVCPSLSVQLAKIASIEILMESETNEAKKNAEDTNEKEIKKFFPDKNGHYNIGNTAHVVSSKNMTANNIARKQDVFIPVLTPPPEQV
jgi:hypothetical protein